jgi:hypothetical protein
MAEYPASEAVVSNVPGLSRTMRPCKRRVFLLGRTGTEERDRGLFRQVRQSRQTTGQFSLMNMGNVTYGNMPG